MIALYFNEKIGYVETNANYKYEFDTGETFFLYIKWYVEDLERFLRDYIEMNLFKQPLHSLNMGDILKFKCPEYIIKALPVSKNNEIYILITVYRQ